MPIRVEYTPYAEIRQLAQQAGQAEQLRAQQEFQQKQDLMMLDNQLRQQNMAFQAQLEQAARGEEFMYQTKLLQLKRDIDIQLEAVEYQRNREKLNMALNQIRQSDSLTDEEKEQLTLQAVAKFSNVGEPISSDFFGPKTTDPLTRKLMESQINQYRIKELEAMVNSGVMTPEEAERQARAAGIGAVKFERPEDILAKTIAEKTEKLNRATQALQEVFFEEKGNVYTKARDKKVKENDPLYTLYKTLKARQEQARQELEQAMSSNTALSDRATFDQELEKSPTLQKAVELFGYTATYNHWLNRVKGRSSVAPLSPSNPESLKEITKKPFGGMIGGY